MEESITQVIKNLYDRDQSVTLTRPDPAFGDYSTNVALQLAKPLGKNPREIAEAIAEQLRQTTQFADVMVAGPGFINMRLSDQRLLALAQSAPTPQYAGLDYVLEYSCPNAFKELHTGHLYQTIYGDSLARIIEAAGATVHRTSFGGDVGLHVAKCLWGMVDALGGEHPEKLQEISNDVFERARWISQMYVAGAKAYEDDPDSQRRIIELNSLIYGFHEQDDHSSNLAQIYWQTRQWSFDYFTAFYNMIDVADLRYIAESQTSPIGMEVVRQQLDKGNLQRSDGAVVFVGDPDKHLHTRVFVTSSGLPTYETKDIGVVWLEVNDYQFDHRILITGNDQQEYMRVVFAAADTFRPGIGQTMTHLTNGTVRFADGKKMSSRLGNVARAADVIQLVKERVKGLVADQSQHHAVALGAVKYAFLKYRIGGDISFDIEETVSLQGNSGPYIQYAHARACSILAKADEAPTQLTNDLQPAERALLRKLSEFGSVVDKAAQEYMTHGICNYLYELAQEFNRFYEHNRVLGGDRQATRLALVRRYRDTLASGLMLLGIEAPTKL